MQSALDLKSLSLRGFISALACDSLRQELLPSRLQSCERRCLTELIRQALLKLPKSTKPLAASSFASLEERLQCALKDLALDALLVMQTETEASVEFARSIRLLLLRVAFPVWPRDVVGQNLDPWLLMDLANCCNSEVPANIQKRITQHIAAVCHIDSVQDAETLASFGSRFQMPQLAGLIARLNTFHPQVAGLFVQHFFDDAILVSKYCELTSTSELRTRLYSSLLHQGPVLLLNASPHALEKLSSFEVISTRPRELIATLDLAVELYRILDMRSLSLEGLKQFIFRKFPTSVALCEEGVSDLLASKYWTLLSAVLSVDQLLDYSETLKSHFTAVFGKLGFYKAKAAACRGVCVFLAGDNDIQFCKRLIPTLIGIATSSDLPNKLRWNVSTCLSSLLQCPGSVALTFLADEFLYGKVLHSWYVELDYLKNFKLAASMTELIVRWAIHLGHPSSLFDTDRIWSASKACERHIAVNSASMEHEEDSEEAMTKSAERLLVALKTITGGMAE